MSKESTHRITKVTKKTSNSFDQEHLEHLVYIHLWQWPAPNVDWCDVARVTIDTLPDVALLRIFDFYLHHPHDTWIKAWRMLVHVCRYWQNVTFESPRRLGVRLLCAARTTVREKLDLWPQLPIVVRGEDYYDEPWGMDNVICGTQV